MSATLPQEMCHELFEFCDAQDIVAFCSTCRFYRQMLYSEFFWKKKLSGLASRVGFPLPELELLVELGVNLLATCVRLEKVVNESSLADPCDFFAAPRHEICQHKPSSFPEIWMKIGTIENNNATTGSSKVSQQDANSKSTTMNRQSCLDLKNPHRCLDLMDKEEMRNLELYSLLQLLRSKGNFCKLKPFLDRYFGVQEIAETLSNRNSNFTFYEPMGVHQTIRRQLVRYFFEQVKVNKLCMIPAALSISQEFSELDKNYDTYIYIETGGLETVVAIVLKSHVIQSRFKIVPIGAWNLNPSFTADVGHKRNGKKLANNNDLHKTPQMMYKSLGLPAVIAELTKGMKDDEKKECMELIVLCGDHRDMCWIRDKLENDLRRMMPKYEAFVVQSSGYVTSDRWRYRRSSLETKPQYERGRPFFMTREQYVLYGCQSLQEEKPSKKRKLKI